ncbi:hypothetical protein ACTYEO_05390 [Rhodophyticola sp. SM2404]
MRIRNAAIKAAIVLVPSYIMAFLTEQMVYVVPMLAASSFFAGAVDFSEKTNRRRVDEDEADQGDQYDEYEVTSTNEVSDTVDVD